MRRGELVVRGAPVGRRCGEQGLTRSQGTIEFAAATPADQREPDLPRRSGCGGGPPPASV